MKYQETPARKYHSHRSERSHKRFQERLAELGATLLEDEWLGSQTRHRVICAAGHECSPRPTGVNAGQGVCRACAGNDPRVAEAAFRNRIAELGATLIEPIWLGCDRPHRVICANGHECNPSPGSVKQGQGICGACVGRSSSVAEAMFRARLGELGATLIEPAWLGGNVPHRVLCAKGHECTPRPSNVRLGHGICEACANRCARTAEAAFRSRLEELGAVLLEPKYLGGHRPHRIQCAAGHACSPRPSHVLYGHGVCRFCANKEWDSFYVVGNEDADLIKVGITNGAGRQRLTRHRRDGYTTVVRFLQDLPAGVAFSVETDVLATLRLAREKPVRGREYFPDHVTALVLDVVDHYPIPDPGRDERPPPRIGVGGL